MREVDVALVEGMRLRWCGARIARVICRSCGMTSGVGEEEVETLMARARRLVAKVLAERGMDAAVDASGLTDRTVERWAAAASDGRLSDALPQAIMLTRLGRNGLVSDPGDGRPLDVAALDAVCVSEALSRRGGQVDVAWTSPDMRLREGVERAFPGCEVRIPVSMSRSRLDAMLAPLDVPNGPPDARLLFERVSVAGWDADALERLRDCLPTRDARGRGFQALWDDALVAGMGHPDPVTPHALPDGGTLVVLRAHIAFGWRPWKGSPSAGR